MAGGSPRCHCCRACSSMARHVKRRPQPPKHWPCARLPIASNMANHFRPRLAIYSRCGHELLASDQGSTIARRTPAHRMANQTPIRLTSSPCTYWLVRLRVCFSRYGRDRTADVGANRETYRADTGRFVSAVGWNKARRSSGVIGRFRMHAGTASSLVPAYGFLPTVQRTNGMTFLFPLWKRTGEQRNGCERCGNGERRDVSPPVASREKNRRANASPLAVERRQ